LQKRIRDCTGPDRQLDAEICAALHWGPHRAIHSFAFKFPVWRGRNDGRVDVLNNDGSTVGHFKSEELTTYPDGLGACVALMREVLPGAIREVEATGKLPKVTVWRYHDIVWQARSTEEHAIENHATLLAIISARIAELEAEQEKETTNAD
jgi:hypothetical protein